jgi:hypothetical protein
VCVTAIYYLLCSALLHGVCQDILDSMGKMIFEPELVAKDGGSVAKILELKDDVRTNSISLSAGRQGYALPLLSSYLIDSLSD